MRELGGTTEAWADWTGVHSGYSEEATPFVMHACIHSFT